MSHSLRDQTLALAGMMQAGELVRQVACSGQCGRQAAGVSIASVFERNPTSVDALFGGLNGLRLGLTMIAEVFGGHAQNDHLQCLQYTLGMIKLSGQLLRDQARQQKIGTEIDLASAGWRACGKDGLEPTVLSQLADIYQQYISVLGFRITVSGQPEYLKQPQKVTLVRSLLLAGIRSATLWRQVGGRHWKLIFQRRKFQQQAQMMAGS